MFYILYTMYPVPKYSMLSTCHDNKVWIHLDYVRQWLSFFKLISTPT